MLSGGQRRQRPAQFPSLAAEHGQQPALRDAGQRHPAPSGTCWGARCNNALGGSCGGCVTAILMPTGDSTQQQRHPAMRQLPTVHMGTHHLTLPMAQAVIIAMQRVLQAWPAAAAAAATQPVAGTQVPVCRLLWAADI